MPRRRLDPTEKLRAIADDFGAELREDYSGRGMFGRECLGIVTDEPRAVIAAAKRRGIGGERTDSMGRSAIVYWPDVSLEPEDRTPDPDQEDAQAADEIAATPALEVLIPNAAPMERLATARGFRSTWILARGSQRLAGETVPLFCVISRTDGATHQRVVPYLDEAPAREYFAAYTTPIEEVPVDKSPAR